MNILYWNPTPRQLEKLALRFGSRKLLNLADTALRLVKEQIAPMPEDRIYELSLEAEIVLYDFDQTFTRLHKGKATPADW